MEAGENISDDEYKTTVEKVSIVFIRGCSKARDAIEKDVEAMKVVFKSQSKDLCKKVVFEEKPGTSFRHSWGIVDKLCKSGAIDVVGSQYLLGVFETIPEAEKAFDDWNAEFDDSILGYYLVRDAIAKGVEATKDFFKAPSKDLYKTMADVMKEIWKVFEEKSGLKMPPLDEEFLAELAEIPAVDESSFRHPWGIADKLYKSEAIDAFGFKYLLGVFETIPEAEQAFADWNAEFEQARTDMESELDQWSKQEQARLDADVAGQEAMKVVMEQGRA